ncbi:hypothetical protein ABJB18_06385 [Bifidobacterium bifidum]|jgi:hypothetical protein|nr:hypothetical protein [Bifidobacterium bifidum]MDB1214730.1 hypothetical protein [Bifidobacterium bifidum]MDB1215513.1 hypothetical protein [Bifidobacterium bifidum]MDB1217735.1 hypothetical protein [Bifidobacterium bifidum]MDB1221100.1 hypothetical protein [Bifidobacterium bifidum]MDB1249062.1 hypothetical protein [Bifidobacterium bifidum]
MDIPFFLSSAPFLDTARRYSLVAANRDIRKPAMRQNPHRRE